MKIYRIFLIVFLLSPVIVLGQLKKDIEKPNISNTLITNYNNNFLGFLDPSRLTINHSLSMAYTSIGGTDLVLNTYLNTMRYQLSDNLSITTKLGILASPYNTLPDGNALSDGKLFGGAEIRYMPSKNTIVSLSFESSPYYYRPNSFYHMSDRFGLFKE